MGFKDSKGSLRNMSAYVNNIPDDIVEKLTDDEGAELAREGAELMRTFIATRGTEKSGKEGRVETGLMLRRVRGRVRRTARGRIRIEWGWLSDRRKYFRYQEQGFTHNSGVTNYESRADVEPMHALLDSYIILTERTKDALSRRFRR